MIRLAHFADIHVGATLGHGPKDPDGIPARLKDQESSAVQMAKDIVSAECNAVLFSGDGFRVNNPTATEERAFQRMLQVFSAAGLPCYAVPGNHDIGSGGEANALEVFQCDYFRLRSVPTWEVATAGPLDDYRPLFNLLSVPYFRRDYILAADPSISREQADQRCGEAAEAVIHGLLAQCDPSLPTVIMAHHNVPSARLSNGYETLSQSDPFIPLRALDRAEVTYTALGHIHRHQDLGTVCPVVFSGSPAPHDFGEEKTPHGWVLVELEAGEPARYSLQPGRYRDFCTLDLSFVDDPEPSALTPLRRALETTSVRGKIVRVRYDYQRQQKPAIHHAEMRDILNLAGAWHIADPQPTCIDAGQVVRVEGLTSTSVDPLSAATAYISHPEHSTTYGPHREGLLAKLNTLLQEDTARANAA